MEMVMSNGFAELSPYEIDAISAGGKVKDVLCAFGGCVLVANAPAIGCIAGVFGTPAVGVAAGFGCASGGFYLLDQVGK